MKAQFQKFFSFEFWQKFGKCLMVVIAVMPAAGLMISIGKTLAMIDPNMTVLVTTGGVAPDIRKKLQRIEGLQDYTIRDVVRAAEKVYHRRETEDEKLEREKREKREEEDRRDRRQEKVLTRILAAVGERDNGRRGRQSGNLGDKRQQGRSEERRVGKECGR